MIHYDFNHSSLLPNQLDPICLWTDESFINFKVIN
jgi:hypothetical protein